MLETTKELLTISNARKSEYIMMKPIVLYLESLIHKGDSVLDKKISQSEKTISDCYEYIVAKAREMAQGANSIGIESNIVFGWARHYYDELGNPEDMPKQASCVKKSEAEYEKIKEEQERKEKELQRLSDLVVSSLKWEKDKKARKFADAYLESVEKKKLKADDVKYINWVTRSIVTSDLVSSLVEIDCDPDDLDVQSIIKSTIGDMKISKAERKEVMANDMPTLF